MVTLEKLSCFSDQGRPSLSGIAPTTVLAASAISVERVIADKSFPSGYGPAMTHQLELTIQITVNTAALLQQTFSEFVFQGSATKVWQSDPLAQCKRCLPTSTR